MEYAADSMWNTLNKYPNNVWNIPWSRTIPHLFCIILSPLGTILKQATFGYNLKSGQRLNHLLYIDDFKLYARTENEIKAQSILVVWLECRFLETEVDGSNPGNSMLFP